MTKIEKINKLTEVLEQLKSEFIGLDSIIDEIGNAITPWYITPEIIHRPVVISLWGMTGTGKSSVVRRLIELLNLKPKSLMFDCGEENNDGSTSVSDKICEFIQADDLEVSIDSITKDLVFVFDEFQYARTLDEQGAEVGKANLRPVWSLIDSGIINLNQNSWDIGTYCNFVEDLAGFVKEYPGIKVKNCDVTGKDDVKTVLDALGLFYFGRGLPGFMRSKEKYGMGSVDEDDKEDDPYRPLRIVEDNIFRILVRRLKSVNPDYAKTIIEDIMECETIDSILEILESARSLVMTPKYLDCSKSIVFIIGNLDEAFHVEDDINPDLDADMFYSETSKVSVSDIKEALKKRFRAEQIARFGNSIIKYPTLKKEHFEKIIASEVDRICREFKESNGIDVTVSPKVLKLLYSEGVYPVQGIRPVFTTTGTILTPLLSKILIYSETHHTEDLKVTIEVMSDNFKKASCDIEIGYYHKSNYTTETVTIPLALGELRDPLNRKTRVINSIHEAGHAVVMAYLTGKIPTSIVSVSIDHGGFCVTHNDEKINEIQTKQDVANNVCISLAGYEAEMLFFGSRPEMTLCGSSSDIKAAWEDLSDEVYNGGYFLPFSYTSLEVEDGGQIPSGFSDKNISGKLSDEFRHLRDKTRKILQDNQILIAEMADKLSVNGNMDSFGFKSLIEMNKGTLTSRRLEKALKDNSSDWYYTQLNKILKK